MQMLFKNPISDQQKGFFCYIFIRHRPITFVGYTQFVLSLILLAYSIKHFRMSKNLVILPKSMKLTYFLLFLSITLYQMKMILNISIYWIYHDKQDEQTYNKLSYFSKLGFSFDVLKMLTMQGLIILICYNWMERVIILLNKIAQIQSQSQNQLNQILSFEMICQRVIRVYLVFRSVFYLGLLIFILLSQQNPDKLHLNLIFYLLLAEAFFTPVSLIISIYALLKNRKITVFVEKEQIRRLMIQYIILLVCTVFKFTVGLLFTLLTTKSDYNVKCQIDTEISVRDITFTICMYLFQYFFEYFIPILIILRIYDIEPYYRISESLLEHNQNSITYSN